MNEPDNWKSSGEASSELLKKLEKQFEDECIGDGVDVRKQYQPRLPLPRS